jgi:hypothetical protein
MQRASVKGMKYCILKYRCRYQRGGVCIFVHKELCFSHIDLSTYFVEKILELCAVKIESNGWGLIVCLYRSPVGDFCHFLNLLEVLLFLYKLLIELILCGDFNVDYLGNDNCKQQLSVLLNTFSMVHNC